MQLEQFWQKYANPLSGWCHFYTYPLLIIAVYFHSWYLALLAFGLFVLGPFLLPEPSKKKYWITRAILGEQIFYRRQFFLQRHLATTILALSLLTFAFALLTAYNQHYYLCLSFVVLTILFRMWFLDKMVAIYDRNQELSSRS
jgi:hypothetical protein